MTLEKVLVVLVLAAVIVGPHRLPAYAHRLAAFVRGVRSYTEVLRSHVEREVGTPLAVDEWRSLDPRQYDPRRIVREALVAPAPAHAPAPGAALVETPRVHGDGAHQPAIREVSTAGTGSETAGQGTVRTGALGAVSGEAGPSRDAAAAADAGSTTPAATDAPSLASAPARHAGGGGIADLLARSVAAHAAAASSDAGGATAPPTRDAPEPDVVAA